MPGQRHDRKLSRLGYLWQMPRLPPSQSAVMPGLLVGLASGFRRTCQQIRKEHVRNLT